MVQTAHTTHAHHAEHGSSAAPLKSSFLASRLTSFPGSSNAPCTDVPSKATDRVATLPAAHSRLDTGPAHGCRLGRIGAGCRRPVNVVGGVLCCRCSCCPSGRLRGTRGSQRAERVISSGGSVTGSGHAVDYLSGGERPAAAEQSACARAVARLVISHDHSTACAQRLSGSTFGVTAAHLDGVSRRARYRRKALDERFAPVPTARAVRAVGAVRHLL
jgi:hypothetical protein